MLQQQKNCQTSLNSTKIKLPFSQATSHCHQTMAYIVVIERSLAADITYEKKILNEARSVSTKLNVES